MEETPPQVPLKLPNNPHCMTGFAPAQLLFNRKVRNKLSQLTSNEQETNPEVLKNNKEAKVKMKAHADTQSKAKPSKIKIGDLVLARVHNIEKSV